MISLITRNGVYQALSLQLLTRPGLRGTSREYMLTATIVDRCKLREVVVEESGDEEYLRQVMLTTNVKVIEGGLVYV